jgi:hypothetical protein
MCGETVGFGGKHLPVKPFGFREITGLVKPECPVRNFFQVGWFGRHEVRGTGSHMTLLYSFSTENGAVT